jgi:hypothetical protein
MIGIAHRDLFHEYKERGAFIGVQSLSRSAQNN